MPYAHRPDIYDADTHMMERPDWIATFADPDIRPRLQPFLQNSVRGMSTVEDGLAQTLAGCLLRVLVGSRLPG